MRTLLTAICIYISCYTFAQRPCVSAEYKVLRSMDPVEANAINTAEQFIKNTAARGEGDAADLPLLRIPVVLHILYNTNAQNISQALIEEQLRILNRDINHRNEDSVNTPERFRSLAASMNIEFVLATTDPEGRPTTGIIRKQSTITHWSDDDRIKFTSQGGDDAWDTRSYLNIWIGPSVTLVGYSSSPGMAPNRDGVVICTSYFGPNNLGSYNGGRTAVHEVGHWLGLKHIWGDTFCGDDGVDDTPMQGNFTAGCPTGIRSSCNNGAAGDMYMNFMDYTNDACMNLFTIGQTLRVRAGFMPGGPRYSILSSKGLTEPWKPALEPQQPEKPAFSLFPNPAIGISWLVTDSSWAGQNLQIINATGIPVMSIARHAGRQQVNLSALPSGLYFLQGEKGGEQTALKFIKL